MLAFRGAGDEPPSRNVGISTLKTVLIDRKKIFTY